MTTQPTLFKIGNTEGWKSHLVEEGYAVIENILEKSRYEEVFKQFAADWKSVSPNFDFHDKSTWTTDNSPMMWGKGMVYSSGLGQADFMWDLRTNERIIEIWEQIHGTRELVVSYDGFSVFLTREQKPKMWLHVDQNQKDPIYSIQGAYNFLPVGENDAGLIVVPRSHMTYTVDVPENRQFILIDPEDAHVERAVKLIIPANCFVLWNSKTIHANAGMEKPKTVELNRVTAYIAYFPKADRSEIVRKQRLAGYRNADNCGHYATRHDVKRHPYGLKKRYEERAFIDIKPRLNKDEIPAERLALI
jgi:ectoine hydroxylase-related dioxygenase (phytanoyl-CoA dioxygenase family)